MALDFAVLTEDEASADIVSLEWAQHDVLIDLARRLKLTHLLRCEDYFEEVAFTPAQLSKLSEELGIVKKTAVPIDIFDFACGLEKLIAIARQRNKNLSAVPD
jgi:hypothetical protein